METSSKNLEEPQSTLLLDLNVLLSCVHDDDGVLNSATFPNVNGSEASNYFFNRISKHTRVENERRKVEAEK